MGITSALVLFFVIWFLVFLVVIPIRLETQGDVGEVEPWTHAGAPADPKLKKKAWITTGISAVIWVIITSVILSGNLTIHDIDFFNRMSEHWFIAQLVAQLTFNQWVTGSNPVRLTTKINDLAEIIHKLVKLRVPNGFQNRAPHLQRARARARPLTIE